MRASRRGKKRRFKKYRFINGPVTTLAIPVLLDKYVTVPYEDQPKPSFEVVVVTIFHCYPSHALEIRINNAFPM